MVEFALALPVLLLMIFGIIEFARIFQAWLSVENGARFGVRYAVTGDFDMTYCVEAGDALGLKADDLADGQIDCRVPAWIADYEDKEGALTDYARLPSIHDIATQGAMAIVRDSGQTQGNPRFFKVTVCPIRGLTHPEFRQYSPP
ncbi:MAG TPA: TadE family protein, partial [Anaerolineales bacterium]|nr:TadE family protein [Anaerolineales bacterium]